MTPYRDRNRTGSALYQVMGNNPNKLHWRLEVLKERWAGCFAFQLNLAIWPYAVCCKILQHILIGAFRGPSYQHGLTLILALISGHMPSKVWECITYFTLYIRCDYLSILRLNLNYISEEALVYRHYSTVYHMHFNTDQLHNFCNCFRNIRIHLIHC